ncbi:MAG: amidohydrolase family protein [Desulfovibrio sp.]|nr:amidohydrolase family protein [Desulfovibrio sp.]
MTDNEKKGKSSLDINRRDFLRHASVGLMVCATTPLSGGSATAGEAKSKPANALRTPNTVKSAVSKNNGKADLLILGNIITMNEHKPFAEAVAVKGDKILYVGASEVAKKLCDKHTKRYDYGKNSVYPGFLESHCHPGGAGSRMTLMQPLDPNASLEECVLVMKKYMEAHPEKKILQGQGFEERDVKPHHGMLDAICPDKIMICTDSGGHSMWLNGKAMEAYGINKQAVDKWGTECVRVDENGRPTGYISEGPVFYIREQTSNTLDEMKLALSAWQDYALSRGYTASYNAGVELISSFLSPRHIMRWKRKDGSNIIRMQAV